MNYQEFGPAWFRSHLSDRSQYVVISNRFTSSCIVWYPARKPWYPWTLATPQLLYTIFKLATTAAGPYAGGFEGFDRTPYLFSLKLILSLDIKY